MLNNYTKIALLLIPLLDTITYFALGGDVVSHALKVSYFQWIIISFTNTLVLIFQLTILAIILGTLFKKATPHHFFKILQYSILINFFMTLLSTITVFGFRYV
jgi:hypothetical protein